MCNFSGWCFPAVFPRALSPRHKATRALVVWCSDAGCSTRRTQAEVYVSAPLVHCVLPAQCYWGPCYTPSVGWVPTGPTDLHYRQPTYDRSVQISYLTRESQNWKDYLFTSMFILFNVVCCQCSAKTLSLHFKSSKNIH